MEAVWEMFQQVWAFASPHWPGLSWFATAMLVGQVMSKRVFTRQQAAIKRPQQWIWWWGRKTLALHPVVAGVMVGLIWRNPEGVTPAWPWIANCMYFGFFGGFSTWAYEVFKGLAKKQGIDLDIPGGDAPSVPPSAS